MPLYLILIIALTAMATLAALLHQLGYSKRATLTDTVQARELFEKENPESVVDRAVLSRDGLTALFILRGGGPSLGLIQSVGDDFLTRILSPGQITSVDKAPDNTLNIIFSDFTYPRAHVHLRTPSDVTLYHQCMNKLVTGKTIPQKPPF